MHKVAAGRESIAPSVIFVTLSRTSAKASTVSTKALTDIAPDERMDVDVVGPKGRVHSMNEVANEEPGDKRGRCESERLALGEHEHKERDCAEERCRGEFSTHRAGASTAVYGEYVREPTTARAQKDQQREGGGKERTGRWFKGLSIIRKARSEGVQRRNASTRWRWISTIMLPVGEQWGSRRGRSGQKSTFGKVRLSVADKGTHKNGTPKSVRGFFPKAEAACNGGAPFLFSSFTTRA